MATKIEKKLHHKEKIKLGLSNHFHKGQWTKDQDYLNTCIEVNQGDLKLHRQTTSTAFKNLLGFLNSVCTRKERECRRRYQSALDEDQNNLNALIGLSESASSEVESASRKESLKNILDSDIQERAIAKASLEIGLALCLLVPKYESSTEPPVAQETVSENHLSSFSKDEYEILEFRTKPVHVPKEVDFHRDCHSAQRERVYSSIRYLEEGLSRLSEVQPEDKADILVWKFFLAMAHNRLDHWLSQTSCSPGIRKQVTLRGLGLFCEIITNFDSKTDKYSRLYVQRSLAYVGQILTGRKDVLMEAEAVDFVPECFESAHGHFLKSLWEDPNESFRRAEEFGFDAIVATRNAKRLLHESNFDDVIRIVDEVFEKDAGIHWFASSIRMRAYKFRYKAAYDAAKKRDSMSSLENQDLLKAEEDGNYCFDSNATWRDLLEFATVLVWLGTFPDGKNVTDERKILEALSILNRLYIEHGCHIYYKVHKQRADCHAHLGQLDEAINYMSWSLTCCPDKSNETKPSVAFTLLINHLLKKLEVVATDHDKTNAQTQLIMDRIVYHMIVEIKRCLENIRTREKVLSKNVWSALQPLLMNYNKRHLTDAKAEVDTGVAEEEYCVQVTRSDQNGRLEILCHDAQQKFIEQLTRSYNCIFGSVRNMCNKVPEHVKRILTSTIQSPCSATSTFVTMCLICLGKDHAPWTRDFNKKWKATTPKKLELFHPITNSPEDVGRYDYLLIHAPEDKGWVFYELLPELENRSQIFRNFRGCIPDRNFTKDLPFEENIKACLGKTSKVLLVITPNFFDRICEVLEKTNIISTIGKMQKEKTIDVMIVFAADVLVQLDLLDLRHVQLLKFKNMKAWSRPVDWNFLRRFLLGNPTLAAPAIWNAAGDNRHVNPREIDNEIYRALEEDILPYGLPEAMCLLCYPAYIVNYDWERKIPRWVAHKIDSKSPRGTVSRKTHPRQLRDYKYEPRIPPLARSSIRDYKQDKRITAGHVTPLADHSETLESARCTMYLTNIVPESVNLFFWNRLEEFCRDILTRDFEAVYVLSGTLFLSSTTEDGKKVVKYEVIGGNEVAKPTHFFKVIMGKTLDTEKPDKMGAFLVPNESLFDAELKTVEVTIKEVEKHLRIDLFPTMDQSLKVESSTLPKTFFSKKERMQKTIRYIDTLVNLELVWGGLPSSMKEDKDLLDLYKEKQARFSKTERTGK